MTKNTSPAPLDFPISRFANLRLIGLVILVVVALVLLLLARGDTDANKIIDLVSMFENGPARKYPQAASGLAKIGKPAIPTILELLEDGNIWAAMALQEMGSDAADTVPALVQAVQEGEPSMRAFASNALGQIGVSSDEALTVLIQTLEDEHWNARQLAAGALGYLSGDDPRVKAALTKALQDENEKVRWDAGRALDQIQKKTGGV